MRTDKPIRIVAMGKYLPKKVTSQEIETLHGIPLGWSEKYSGVSTRHHVTNEYNGLMGARATEEALAKANMSLNDIDMLISASGTYDYPIPNQACIIKNELKGGDKTDFPAIDIDSTCLSFVAALDLSSKILDGESYKNILIVSSEIASKGIDHDNWETTTLFGDGAVATIVSYDPSSGSKLIKGNQKTYSEGAYLTIIEGGGNKNFFKDYPYDMKLHSFKMKGKQLIRLAKRKIPIFMNDFFGDLPIGIEDVDAIIPHQASKLGLVSFKKLFNLKDHQVKETLHKYGNCIAASIPLTLLDSIDSGDVKRGDVCFLSGTSAGFSIGGVLIKY